MTPTLVLLGNLLVDDIVFPGGPNAILNAKPYMVDGTSAIAFLDFGSYWTKRVNTVEQQSASLKLQIVQESDW